MVFVSSSWTDHSSDPISIHQANSTKNEQRRYSFLFYSQSNYPSGQLNSLFTLNFLCSWKGDRLVGSEMKKKCNFACRWRTGSKMMIGSYVVLCVHNKTKYVVSLLLLPSLFCFIIPWPSFISTTILISIVVTLFTQEEKESITFKKYFNNCGGSGYYKCFRLVSTSYSFSSNKFVKWLIKCLLISLTK